MSIVSVLQSVFPLILQKEVIFCFHVCRTVIIMQIYLLKKGMRLSASSPDLFEPVSDEEAVITDVKQKFSHEQVTAKLATAFEHPFWVENSLRCIGCGACAYVCPTCACFDIQDETRGKTGNVTAAGIPADSDCSHFILQDIIRGMFRARDGDSG